MVRVGVKVMTRESLLDPQGIAVAKSLQEHKMEVSSVRIGKYIILDFEEGTKEQALLKAKKIAEELLVNPISEDFELEIRT